MSELVPTPNPPETLVQDLRRLIADARRQTAAAVNIGLTLLYWRLGDRIRREVLGLERAAYGEQIVATVSHELATEFGRGFERTNLTRMMKFAEAFPDEQIVATLSQQLSWSHFRELLPLDKPLQREFYAEMCRMEGWSVRTLRGRIDSMLYERTALSRKPEELARQELATLKNSGEVGPALVLKDPYILDFLDLKDQYIERASKTLSCGNSRCSCSNWVLASPSSHTRSAFSSTERIFPSGLRQITTPPPPAPFPPNKTEHAKTRCTNKVSFVIIFGFSLWLWLAPRRGSCAS